MYIVCAEIGRNTDKPQNES